MNRKEVLLGIAATVGVLGLSTLAFTDKQRIALRQRDGNKCNFPEHLNGHRQDCGGRLEVHHILPQRYARELGVDPDFPENAITICQNAHSQVHPDMKEAKRKYGVNKQSYQEMFQAREESLEQRQIYWDDEWDREMSVMAVRNTQKAHKKGWRFPSRESKNK